MKRLKKCIIALVLVIAVLGSAVYLIEINNNTLLKPKIVVSNYKLCQKANYKVRTGSYESSIHKDVVSRYIDSDNEYDYYIESIRNWLPGNIEEDYFIKKKGNKIVAAFDLKELNLARRNDLYTYCGFYNNGYLYFTIEGTNSIFCIDDCFTNCSIYFTPQKFGKINVTSFCIAEDILYYITDSGSLVKYDGTEEVQIKNLPKIPSAFEDDDSSPMKEYSYINVEDSAVQVSDYSYYLNCINGKFYYGMENKLFCVDDEGNVEYLNFEIPPSSSGSSHIYRIEPYKNNSSLVAVSFYYVDINPEGRSPGTIRYVLNPENGDYIKCKQRANKWNRHLSDNKFEDYIDKLRSMAGSDG